VPATLGILPGRVTYIIDKQGTVRQIFNSQLNFKGHIEAALKVIKQIQIQA
jgi:thioredoxin-dependent peroxiredoxin